MKYLLLALVLSSAPSLAFADCETLSCKLAREKGVHCISDSTGSICVLPPNFSGFNYSQEIGVLIPPNVTLPNRLILFMHGNRGLCPALPDGPITLAVRWNLLKQMNSAGATDAVAFFPMSLGSTTTYDKSLAPRFAAFKAWAEKLVGVSSAIKWTLAGHSGSGRAIASILGLRNASVDSALLLDAAYNVQTKPFVSSWNHAKGGPAELYNVYTDNSGTLSNLPYLIGLLGGQLESHHSNTNEHCDVPLVDYGEQLAKALRAH